MRTGKSRVLFRSHASSSSALQQPPRASRVGNGGARQPSSPLSVTKLCRPIQSSSCFHTTRPGCAVRAVQTTAQSARRRDIMTQQGSFSREPCKEHQVRPDGEPRRSRLTICSGTVVPAYWPERAPGRAAVPYSSSAVMLELLAAARVHLPFL